jgi:hypothetical protein
VRFGVNLRGNLAKLSDAAVAEHLECCLNRRETLAAFLDNLSTVGNKWLYQKGFGMPFGRGLLHARPLYRLYRFLYGGLDGRSLGDLYVLDCKIKDTRDEIGHSLRKR